MNGRMSLFKSVTWEANCVFNLCIARSHTQDAQAGFEETDTIYRTHEMFTKQTIYFDVSLKVIYLVFTHMYSSNLLSSEESGNVVKIYLFSLLDAMKFYCQFLSFFQFRHNVCCSGSERHKIKNIKFIVCVRLGAPKPECCGHFKLKAQLKTKVYYGCGLGN